MSPRGGRASDLRVVFYSRASKMDTTSNQLFMKKRLYLPSTATICLLVAVLSLSNALPVGAVVCVGQDGHVGVETFLAGCCVGSPPPAGSGAAGSIVGNSSCGNCADVQLKVSSLRAEDSRLEKPDLGAGSVERSTSFSSNRPSRSTDAVNTDQQQHSLRPLSTVVLRT